LVQLKINKLKTGNRHASADKVPAKARIPNDGCMEGALGQIPASRRHAAISWNHTTKPMAQPARLGRSAAYVTSVMAVPVLAICGNDLTASSYSDNAVTGGVITPMANG